MKSEIVGSVKMKCYLSGMPELRLGLNDKVLFENTGSKLLHIDVKIRYCFAYSATCRHFMKTFSFEAKVSHPKASTKCQWCQSVSKYLLNRCFNGNRESFCCIFKCSSK